MADWITHLYLAEKVQPYLGLRGEDFQKFKWGCLIPDVNDGYVIEPDIKLDRVKTHFGGNNFYSMRMSLIAFKNNIEDPVIKGIIFHLVVDKLLSFDYYSRVPLEWYLQSNTEGDFMKAKWNDTWLYVKQSMSEYPDLNLDVIKEVKSSVNAKTIYEVTEADLLKVKYVLPTLLSDVGDKYIVYTPEELSCLYSKIIDMYITVIQSFCKNYV